MSQVTNMSFVRARAFRFKRDTQLSLTSHTDILFFRFCFTLFALRARDPSTSLRMTNGGGSGGERRGG